MSCGRKSRATIGIGSLFFMGLWLASCMTQHNQPDGAIARSSEAGKNPTAGEAAIILGARNVPVPPAPSGPPPRSPHTTPASYYEPVGPFFFYVETLTANGPNKYGFAPTQPCIQSGVFKRGQKMVVRFEILDTKSGKRVTDKDGAMIKLLLPSGEEVAGRWAVRGAGAALPDSAWMWDTSWDIPPDFPLGSLDYRIKIGRAHV